MTATVCTRLQAQGPDGQQVAGQQPLLLNFVPPYASPPVPLLLLDPAFGKLRGTIDGRVQLKAQDYHWANALVQASSRMYDSELQRRKALLGVFQGYMHDLDCTVTDQPTWATGLARPDIAVIAVQCGKVGCNAVW